MRENKFYLSLLVGFAALASIRWMNYGSVYVHSVFLWLVIFQFLTAVQTERKKLILTGFVFCAGFIIRFFGTTGVPAADTLVLGLIGAGIYGLFLINGRLLRRFEAFAATLIFPILWMAGYQFMTFLRVPSSMRIDVMLFDCKPILQAESLIGSGGLSLCLLWITSLIVYGLCGKKHRFPAAVLSMGILVCLSGVGFLRLQSAKEPDFYLKTAYTTGPYVGDFLHYEDIGYDAFVKSMETSVLTAAKEGAEILVFSEEAFSVKDTKEEAFCSKVCELAKEKKMHILYGLDVKDTDDSEGGKSINKIVWVDEHGQVLDEYVKYQIIPGIEAGYKRGEGEIPTHSVKIGEHEVNVSFAICYDSNFPSYLKRMDENTEVLFLPSWDWKSITRLHYRICGTIGVENNLTLLKPTYDGITIAADPYSRIVTLSNTEDTGFEQVQMLDLPVWKKEKNK